jgi:superfamily II DNA or RNA helicase
MRQLIREDVWKRGLRYQAEGGVQMIVEAESHVLAHVRESEGANHEVRVEKVPGRDKIQAFCACPIGYACKHVAAVLIELGQGHGSGPMPAAQKKDPLTAWLDGWEDAQTVGRARRDEPSRPSEMYSSERFVAYLLESKGTRPRQLVVGSYLARRQPMSQRAIADRRVSLEAIGGGAGGARNDAVRHADRRLWFELGQSAAAVQAIRPGEPTLPMLGPRAITNLEALVKSRNCFWESFEAPLSWGPRRQGKLRWRVLPNAEQELELGLEGVDGEAALLLPVSPPHYCLPETGEIGALDLDALGERDPALVDFGFKLGAERGEGIDKQLAKRLKTLDLPSPHLVERTKTKKPKVRLRISAIPELPDVRMGSDEIDLEAHKMDRFELAFDYGKGEPIPAHSDEVLIKAGRGNKVQIRPRDESFERECHERLSSRGLSYHAADGSYYPYDRAAWRRLVAMGLDAWKRKGWTVDVEPEANLAKAVVDVLEVGDLFAAFEAMEDADWTTVGLEVEVEGRRVSLLPAIITGIRRGELTPDGILAADGGVLLELPDGGYVRLAVERLQKVLDLLIELFDENWELDEMGRLIVPNHERPRLVPLCELPFEARPQLRDLLEGLADFERVEEVKPPRGLRAELRSYQQTGLNWLAFLRKHGFGGILADDMGLGKTLQCLSHILREKQARRLDRPTLVVAPRSVLTNWSREAARFTPRLDVAVWHGVGRSALGKPEDWDIVITSYATLCRDEALLTCEWHYVVLDEAQAIKNPRSKTAQAACQLHSRHRLCLTGTPVENNLLELWSLFHFLMPGYLGDKEGFGRRYRKPIEREGNEEVMQALSSRIAPFVLRREKVDVLEDLPSKTEIVEWVSLEGEERDLYETLRLAVEKKVRDELKRRGLMRSQIYILDALLKLRQCCCHPQLVDLPRAKTIGSSGKLDRLMDRLDAFVAAGRRVLVFSQFVSMIRLIEAELDERDYGYLTLTGRTRKRQQLVDRFQAGEAPVFLISLKAGGTGLNLTAADVVIHYDPWWNPAVERQATDRAYRIGQDKPVTVYKLVVEGSVESKILDLQARKAALAEGVQSGAKLHGGALTAQDLDVLLAPLAGGDSEEDEE